VTDQYNKCYRILMFYSETERSKFHHPASRRLCSVIETEFENRSLIHTRNLSPEIGAKVHAAFACLPYTKHRTNKICVPEPHLQTTSIIFPPPLFPPRKGCDHLFTDKHDVALIERRKCATQITVNTLKCSRLQYGVVINKLLWIL